MQNQKRIYYLDVARVLAIISISLNHAVNRTYDNYGNIQGEFNYINWYSTLFKTVVTVFSRLGVPLFLMITGALLLNRDYDSKPAIKKFYTRNYLDLLITSAIWLFLGFWFIVLVNPSNTLIADHGIWYTIWNSIKNIFFIDMVSFGDMWYIPMILCVYLIIPIIAFFIKKSPSPYVILIPTALLIMLSFVIPAVNVYLPQLGLDTIASGLSPSDLFSLYLVYVIAGYCLYNRKFGKIPNAILIVCTILSFVICCAFQYYCYSWSHHLVSYTSPGILICSVLLLEVIRRYADKLIILERPVTYLSRIAFAIYLVHMFIMEPFYWYFNFSGWSRQLKLFFLEAVSILGSILIIWIFSHIPFCRKRLFLIK